MLLGTVLVLLLFGGAGPASAHAALRSTDPADGAVLKSAPRALTLTFTESVGLLDDSFRVFDPDNRRVRTGEPQHAADRSDTARVTLPAKLGRGTFTVAWRVVSADSHPVSGAFTFSVGEPTPTTAAVNAGPTEDPVTGNLYDTARYAAYLAAALLIGTAAFVLLCRPADTAPLRTPLRAGWWTLLASTVVLLVLRAPYEAGTGPAGALDPSALAHTLGTRPGLALTARLALLGPAAVLLIRARRRPQASATTGPALTTTGPAVVVAVALALTWAAAEHASAGLQVPLAITSSVLHLLAMAVWLGGLTALLILLHRTTLPVDAVARFSRVAFTAVTVLVVTGFYQSWRGLGSWSALTGTDYGRLLLAKLAGVTLLLTAASFSRSWTARPAAARAATGERVPVTAGGPPLPEREQEPETATGTEAGTVPESESESEAETASGAETGAAADVDTVRGLRRSVLAEVAVAAVVLMVTTALTGTTPGRAETEAADARASEPATGIATASVTLVPFNVGTPAVHGTVQVTLDPGRVGDNSVEAVVFGPDGGLSSVPELRLTFTLAGQKIGPLDTKVTDRGGYWAADAFNLPLPGTWTMKATVRVSDVDQVSETRQVRIER
ncbi:copper resistance CopC/CopD family protein [Streptomyces sp. NPDC059766]|uniref:copper resistance CopC/CopD family protein n=1 Tax=Streptomyces sp. NPDC059766 TaxID=3346940 RepID=UPI003663DF2A